MFDLSLRDPAGSRSLDRLAPLRSNTLFNVRRFRVLVEACADGTFR